MGAEVIPLHLIELTVVFDLVNLVGPGVDALHRVWLAEALNLCLLHSLVNAVPDGHRYVEEQSHQGRKVVFDHGAIRTVDWPPSRRISPVASGASPSCSSARNDRQWR